MLIDVLRLDDPRYVEIRGGILAGAHAQHREGPHDVEKPQGGSMEMLHVLRTTRANLYQLCTDPTELLDIPFPPSLTQVVLVRLFGDSMTILKRSQGANRLCGDILWQQLG